MYPDTDICLFKDWPHNQGVFPMIIIAEPFKITSFECTCTLIWLIQHAKHYLNKNQSHYEDKPFVFYPTGWENLSARRCLKIKNFETLIKLCEFEKRFEKCDKKNDVYQELNFNGNFNNMFHFKWLEYLVLVYITPFFSILGCITNFLNILVCREIRKDSKLKKNVMYKHMHVNTFFGLVYCLIQSFSLISTCIFPMYSFCSNVFKGQFAQYFKILIILFLGNTIKICFNFSYIAFSASRFFLSTSSASKSFKIFEKYNIKLFYTFIFVISCLFSMQVLFKYKPNEYYSSFDKDFPYDAYGMNYCSLNVFNIKSFSLICKLFPILEMINNILNNIVFVFVSLLIDLFLFRFAGQTLSRKKKLSSDAAHLDEAIKYRDHINWLVLLNSLMYFCSHVPEFVTQILLLVFKKRLTDFCYFYFSCSKILEISQPFNLVSISLSFFVFKKFDKHFEQSLDFLLKFFQYTKNNI